MAERCLPARFHSLDALRGIAALAVVVWHWRHFFYDGLAMPHVAQEAWPFWTWLRPFYLGGGRAVELFFCLSGFIFYHLYAEKVAQRAISAREFLWLRLSRLYPLHFVTLLLTALGQWLALAAFGAHFVYAENDAPHFLLHLFFVSSWGFERGLSFNGPAWSISVEMLLYGCFFLLCRAGVRRGWPLLALVAAGYALLWTGPLHVGRGVMSFFIGGIVCAIFHRCWRADFPRWAAVLALASAALLWLGLLVDFPRLLLGDLARDLHSIGSTPSRAASFFLLQCGQYFHEWLLFPLTILALALLEAAHGRLLHRVAFLGDLSYATYLLHFPLQLAAVLACECLGLERTLFLSPLVFVAFFAALLLLAWGSYTCLERPAQAWLRARLLPPRSPRI